MAESEKKSQSAVSSFTCSLCKNNLNPVTEESADSEEEGEENADAEEASASPEKKMTKSAKKEANKMRKRVIYLESLLSANLDNLTG